MTEVTVPAPWFRVAWTPASGPVEGYAVYVSRNGSAMFLEQWALEPTAAVTGRYDDVLRVQVAAFDQDYNEGPLSPLSARIRLVQPAEDADADGVASSLDNCPLTPNPAQRDFDQDGFGDLCDICPSVSDPAQADVDGDGTGDACSAPDPGGCPGDGCTPERELACDDGLDDDADGQTDCADVDCKEASACVVPCTYCRFVCQGRAAHIRGTDGDDVIYVSDTDFPIGAVIVTLGGNDTIYGSNANDVICAGPGDDKVYAKGGNDVVLGGDGNDTLYGQAGSDTLLAGVGDDLVDGGPDDDALFGEAGNDSVQGSDGNDDVSGGADTDKVYGGAGDDCLHAGPGIGDKCYGQSGTDDATGCATEYSIEGNPACEF